MSASILQAERITKRYGPLVALDNVSLSFEPGIIHAVLGENGAGKSTLMGILSGFIEPDEGQVLLEDRKLPLGRPFECRHLGIEMIHQHFTLVPEFSIEENLALSRLPSLYAGISPAELAQGATRIGRELGWEMDPKAKVRSLPVGAQQRIEILKALAADPPILIFDEPTAVLSPSEVEELFGVLRRLRDEGRTIILIAHKLREVMSVADRCSVLRLGRLVGSAPIEELDEPTLAHWIVGDLPPERTLERDPPGEVFLSVEKLTVTGDRGEAAVREVSFDLRRREVLGFGGVDGNGQVELAEFLAGVRNSLPPFGGGRGVRQRNRLAESPLPVTGAFRTLPSPRLRRGMPTRGEGSGRIGYIPQNRQADGLALNMSVQDNMTVVGQRLPQLTRGPFLLLRKIRAWAEELIQRFDIRVSRPDERVGSLSGGNQQKVVVSRALAEAPELLVAVNPTRGLDLKAAQFVRDQLLEARGRGAAVALFTTDLDELYELADTRVFMSGGRLLKEGSAEAMLGSSQS